MDSESDALDMMAAEAAEDYSKLQFRLYCSQVTRAPYGLDFLECLQRSSYLANTHFSRISKFNQEMSLQDDEDITLNDPSFLPSSK